MKTIGIIGGLGPQTTAEFYLQLGELCSKSNAPARPRILIESVPLPLDIEQDAIVNGENVELCLPYLINAAQTLEKAGADFLVMPCNSLHLFIAEIRQAVSIPVLSIVEETAAFLQSKGIEKVGVISTSITRKNKLYENVLEKCNIATVNPNGLAQAKLGKIIHNLVNGRLSDSDRQLLNSTIDTMAEDGVKHVILACTDLQLLIPEHSSVQIYDTMQILVEAAGHMMN